MKKLLTWSLVLLAGVGLASVPMLAVYLPSGWKLAPAGTWVEIRDMAAGGEMSPDKRWISFVTVGQGIHQAVILDAKTGDVKSKLNLPGAWIGQAWSDDNTLLISGGVRSEIHQLTVSSTGEAKLFKSLVIKDAAPARPWFGGLAASKGSVWVAAAAGDSLTQVSLETGETVKILKLPEQSSPYQVRQSASGSLWVSLQAMAQVVEVDPESMTIVRTVPTGRHPNDLLISGDRLFVSCGNDDTLDVIDTYTGTREERIDLRPWPDAPPGSTPHALAISPDGTRLYVALSDNNCAAVVDVAVRSKTKVLGYIPTAAYPSGLAALPDGKSLIIASGKGFGTGRNNITDKFDPIAPKGYPYIVTLLKGTLAKVALGGSKELDSYTRTVLQASAYKVGVAVKPRGAKSNNPIPMELGDPSPIEHVLYIIKENRTYDQLFGDLKKDGKPYGDGDPNMTLFGEDVAPNHRRLAMDYVLMDRLFASGEVSVDGHHWTNGAYVTDFMQRTWPQQYSGRSAPRLLPSLAETPQGRIWDAVRRVGKTYKTYYYHTTDKRSEEWAKARASRVRDYQAVDIFINDFKAMEKAGRVPNFMVMALSEDHTSGTRPGAFTPQACVASNDLGLGKIVEAMSSSPLWAKTAIFVIEDDAQNGPDHVDSHRTIGLIISPYTRGRGLDSTHYTTTSMLRTIGLILGTQPMTQHDASAMAMHKAFLPRPNLTPYKALTPKTDLAAVNPPAKEEPLLAAIDFSEPDQLTLAQEVALNKALWRQAKGSVPYPGPTLQELEKRGEKDDD